MHLNNYHDYEQESSQGPVQPRIDQVHTKIDPNYAMQGKIFFLPAKAELPEGAVTRRGKGLVEDGVYNHPVVVVSHPYDDEDFVHFLLITSFQDHRLDELYPNPAKNTTHKNRRTWYLPIAPTPDHPDAISKKTKKQFPTLVLGRGATLRNNSYVSIRRIYKIKHSLLQEYTNPMAPSVEQFRLKGESRIRMIAKCKSLTKYEPDTQFGSLPKPISEPIHASMYVSRPASTYVDRGAEDDDDDNVDDLPPVTCAMTSLNISTNTMATVARGAPIASDRAQSDFRTLNTGTERIADSRPKIPPDIERSRGIRVPQDVSVRQIGQLLEEFESLATIAHRRLVALSYDSTVIKGPLDRAWRDFKGVTAVAIASM